MHDPLKLAVFREIFRVLSNMRLRFATSLALALTLAFSANAQKTASPWTFDVATIRPANEARRTRIMRHPEDTEFIAQNVTLGALVQFAYGVSESRVLNLPPSLRDARFDIQAKGDIDTDARFRRLKPAEIVAAKQSMMQALLAERCGLQVHRETRELPVYALVVDKRGPRLQPNDDPVVQAWAWWNHINVEGGNTLDRFAEELTRVSGRPVINHTGLKGPYSLELEWSDDDDDNGEAPTLFTAIREQLGLNLAPMKAPVEVIVIDHMTLPTLD